MNKKNLLLLVNQLHGGGAQKVIANLSIHLSRHYNVTLAIYNDIDNVVFEHKGELVKLNLPYDDDTHHNPLHKRLIRSLVLVRQVRKLKRRKKIDVTVSFLETSNFINVLSRTGDKIILSVRSYLSHEFKDLPRLRSFSRFIRMLYKRADHIVVPATLVKHDLTTNFNIEPAKVKVIYNFTDLHNAAQQQKIDIPAHHEKIFSRGPVLVNIGRMNQPKAQWLLPGVLAQVKKSIPGTKLLLLGDGILKEKIKEHAQANGLKVYEEVYHPANDTRMEDYDIYLPGFIKNPFPYLTRSALFLMSSVYEGFPNVIIEAMSCGLPIVSSDCDSGPREILQPSSDIFAKTDTIEYAEYGVLTPTPVTGGISDEKYATVAAQAVQSVLTDDSRMQHYQSQSFKRASDFDVSHIIDEWITLIG